MKIVEELAIINADKVWVGAREIKLTLDTDNGRLSIDAPAMFTDPVVSLDVLEATISRLRAHMEH